MPSVSVQYAHKDGSQHTKHFTNAFEARRFYVRKLAEGANPQVRSDTMSETTNATAATPAKKTTKKAAPKASKKKVTPKKKSVPKKVSKSATKKTTKPKADGPNKPQLRILEFLAKQNRSVNRQQISEGANVDTAMLNSYIGSDKPEIREKNDAKVCKSLLTLGLVKVAPPEDESVRGTCYQITAAGKKVAKA